MSVIASASGSRDHAPRLALGGLLGRLAHAIDRADEARRAVEAAARERRVRVRELEQRHLAVAEREAGAVVRRRPR